MTKSAFHELELPDADELVVKSRLTNRPLVTIERTSCRAKNAQTSSAKVDRGARRGRT
jgi:hypothetical protein